MLVPVEAGWALQAGSTLLMPAVSVGNVGQLAIDLIVSTLDMKKVGYFYTDCLVPMVGNNPYATSEDNANELCTNAEDQTYLPSTVLVLEAAWQVGMASVRSAPIDFTVILASRTSAAAEKCYATVYALPSKNLTVLQIRSPLIKKKSKCFCQAVISWIKKCAFSKVVLLSSSHAYQRNDQQLFGTPFRYLVTPALQSSVADVMKELKWKELEKVSLYPGINDEEKRISIPGGGFTKQMFDDCSSGDIKLAVVFKFCAEGDNIPDAFDLLSHLNRWLLLVDLPADSVPSHWKMPSSWRLLFGSGLPPALY